MFPDIETEDGGTSFGEGGVLVRSAFDDEGAIGANAEPCPAAAEASGSGLVELFFEVVEGAEGGIDCSGEITRWFSTAARGEDGPEESVVGMSTTVVANDGTNIFGDGIEIFDEVFNGFGCEGGAFESGVDVVDVGLVMFGVVNFHCSRIDVWFERVVGVGELGQRVGHWELRRSELIGMDPAVAGDLLILGNRREGSTEHERRNRLGLEIENRFLRKAQATGVDFGGKRCGKRICVVGVS